MRATKDSDGFRPLVSEKPEWPAPPPAKREGLDGFGREASNGEEDGQAQGELAPWSVLNQLGVEVSASTRLGIFTDLNSRSLSCSRFQCVCLAYGDNCFGIQMSSRMHMICPTFRKQASCHCQLWVMVMTLLEFDIELR